MLRPRIIPCLLVHGGGLVKTVRFANPKYVGDPLNAVRIFNEKEVDELFVVDIAATAANREPDYKLIKDLAAECRMPLCYGGGVKSVEQVERIVSLGVEKVAFSSAATSNRELISNAAARVGSQSIVVVMDIKRESSTDGYRLYTNNGTNRTDLEPAKFAAVVEELGAGEVVINNIEHDGVGRGYDFEVVARVRNATRLPLTVLGGAGSLKDIADLIRRFGIIGACAGSLFVFKGVYRAVLINYPNRTEKDQLVRDALEERKLNEAD